MADTGQLLLETRGVGMRFGGVKAVEDVDFKLAEGELRCLIGPNGAGKSTFFRCLTKQYQPTSGRILFRGIDVTRSATHEIAQLGVDRAREPAPCGDGASQGQAG